MASSPKHPEVPPTAGLPLAWQDWRRPWRRDLAQRAAAFLGSPAVHLECSGTASLVLALTQLSRLSARKTVIIPAYTCPLVAIAVAHCGLKLRLCDLAPGHFDLDRAMLDALCDQDTLAIVPTHLGGRVADVAAALACARRVGAWVIEDAAQALGARSQGRSVGLHGDVGFFSLAVGKGLTIFEGGLLVAREAALRDELWRLSAAKMRISPRWELQRTLQLLGYTACYRPAMLRYVYGLPLRRALRAGDPVRAVGDEFELAIPLHRVGAWRVSVGAYAWDRLPAWLAANTARAKRRLARLRTIPGITLFEDGADEQGVWPFLMLLLPDQQARDTVLAQLWGAGLGVSRLFIHALPDYAYLAALVAGDPMPQAQDFAARSLTISNSPWLSDAQFEHICEVLQTQAR